MIPYFLLILLPVFIGIISQKYRLKVGKKTIYETNSASIDFFMVIFWVMLALRGLECGSDTNQYLNLYKQYSTSSLFTLFVEYDHELGYKLLNKWIGVTIDSYQVLLGITSVICVVPLWYIYKKESEHPILSIVLFLTVAPFMMYFSGIRQAMAMSFGILAWYAAKHKKRIWFAVIVFMAIQFHISALVLIIIYPLYYARITKKWLWGIIPCMWGIYIFRIPIFNFLIKFLWKEYNMTPETGATTVLILLIIFGIYSYFVSDEKLLDEDTVALRNILLLAIAIQCFAPVHPLSMRMNYYFLIFIPLLIPKIAYRSKRQYKEIARLSVWVMIIFFSGYFIKKVITDDDALNIIPYIPFWRNML